MLDLPSVIELAPCKYKRVYFYFGVQKKLIFIYLLFFYFYFLGQRTRTCMRAMPFIYRGHQGPVPKGHLDWK
jgi:hypothetical protein